MHAYTLIAVLATALAAPAQNSKIIGWVSSPLLPASGGLQSQDIENKCQPAKRLCTNVLLNNPILYAGGSAYEPRRESVWVSDGRALIEVDPASCKTLCKAPRAIMQSGAVFSGLAVAGRRGMLYHLETKPGYLGILPWSNRSCPPVPTKGGCSLQLKNNAFAGGLAYDEVRDLLYYSVSTPGVTGPTNELYVASPTSACRPICRIKLPTCGGSVLFGAVTGLAFNPCTDVLYATDGKTTMRIAMVEPRKCAVKLLGCCAKQTGGGRYQGLALVPGFARKDVGKPCITKACPYCPSLRTTLFGGVPALGNQEFGIEISNGPEGSVGTLALAIGGCTSGAPFLCGSLHLPAAPVILLPMGKLTGTSCAARVRLKLPIPVDPKLCGIRLCLQSIAVCSGGGGYAMSQGLEIRL